MEGGEMTRGKWGMMELWKWKRRLSEVWKGKRDWRKRGKESEKWWNWRKREVGSGGRYYMGVVAQRNYKKKRWVEKNVKNV